MYFTIGLHASSPEDGSKNADAKRWKKGFIVTPKGDTIEGKIKVPDFLDVYYDFQRMVSFANQIGTSEYSPNDLRSFSFYADRDSLVTLQSVSSPDGDGHVFLRLYCTGSCRVYGLTITEVKGAGMTPLAGDGQVRSSLIPTEKKYIQIGGGQFFPLRRIGFKKHMKEIFSSCPRILSGLDANEYSFDNWQKMIQDYNTLAHK